MEDGAGVDIEVLSVKGEGPEETFARGGGVVGEGEGGAAVRGDFTPVGRGVIEIW